MAYFNYSIACEYTQVISNPYIVVQIFLFVDIYSLGSIYRKLKLPLSPIWQEFALQLGLDYDATETIRKDSTSNSSQCLQNALASWLHLDYDYQNNGKPNWRRIAEVVSWLGKRNLFQDIAKNHTGK